MSVPRELEAALAGAREGDERCMHAACDMLDEAGATLTDVLLGYAGQPPRWEEIVPLCVVTRYLELHEPTWSGLELVRRACVDGADPRLVLLPGWPTERPMSAWPTAEEARRFLKRRVLSLFPTVCVRRELRIRATALYPAHLHFYDRTGPEVIRRLVEVSHVNDDVRRLVRDSTLDLGRVKKRRPIEVRWHEAEDLLSFAQDVPAPRWVPPSNEERSRFVRQAAEEFARDA